MKKIETYEAYDPSEWEDSLEWKARRVAFILDYRASNPQAYIKNRSLQLEKDYLYAREPEATREARKYMRVA